MAALLLVGMALKGSLTAHHQLENIDTDISTPIPNIMSGALDHGGRGQGLITL